MKQFAAILTLLACSTQAFAQDSSPDSAPTPTAYATPKADLYTKDGNKLSNNEIQFITKGGTLRAKAKEPYSPEPITREIPLEDITQIVFEGGRAEHRGIVLRNGQISGSLEEFKNGHWRFALAGGAGEMVLNDTSQLLSINLTDTDAPSRESSALSKNVLQWVYEHDPFPFGTEANWVFDIKKITLTEKAILLNADVYSSDATVLNSVGCEVFCKATDNIGRQYEQVVTPYFTVGPKSKINHILVQCPMPASDTESVTLSLKTLKNGKPHRTAKVGEVLTKNSGDFCQGDTWIDLPAISLSLLREQ